MPRKRYKITDGDVVNFCYSHSNTEHNINMLVALHKRSRNADKTQIILFPQGLPNDLSVTLLNNLVKENVRLIESLDHKEFNDAEIRQFKIMQAQTAVCGLAAGDTTAQDCINEGLLPIIEYERFEKADFWLDLIKVLEDFSKYSLNSGNQQQDAETIIKYLNDSIEYTVPFAAKRLFAHVEAQGMSVNTIPELVARGITEQPPFIAPPSCDQLTERCFDLWKNVICPYLRANFNVANKITATVELFRMLGELVATQDVSSTTAIAYFTAMSPERYSQLIKPLSAAMSGATDQQSLICLQALSDKVLKNDALDDLKNAQNGAALENEIKI